MERLFCPKRRVQGAQAAAEMRPPVFPWASEDFAVVFGKLERERLEVFAGMSCGKLGLPLPGPGVVGHGEDFVRVVVGVLRIAGEMELLSGARHCGVEPAAVVGRGDVYKRQGVRRVLYNVCAGTKALGKGVWKQQEGLRLR